MATLNATLRARPYAGPTVLPALLALWPACRPAGSATDFPSPADWSSCSPRRRSRPDTDLGGHGRSGSGPCAGGQLPLPMVRLGAGSHGSRRCTHTRLQAVDPDLHSVSISRDARCRLF